ncbi:MAG: Txe/YoeB family addiction module toxin [Tannerella sp.]|jgi:toxin YoeB|nr:Txe/YoeB family addiction module toxin [Tannerella sp.]
MEVEYKKKALEDREYWKQQGNLKVQNRISELIVDIIEHPFTGIGKPEPLKYELAGLWSRRITQQHRLIYEVLNNRISIVSMKGHYKQ